MYVRHLKSRVRWNSVKYFGEKNKTNKQKTKIETKQKKKKMSHDNSVIQNITEPLGLMSAFRLKEKKKVIVKAL